MRTTLSLDDDVLAVARQRAQRERTSLGEAVSRYTRVGLRANAQTPVTPTSLRSALTTSVIAHPDTSAKPAATSAFSA